MESAWLFAHRLILIYLLHSFKFTPTGGTVTLTVDLQPVLDPDVSIGDIDPDRSTGTISLSSSLHSLNEISLDEDSFVTVPMTPLRRSTITGSPRPKPKFHLRVRCSDTGIGIHHSALATLFDPWTQAPKTSSAEYGGSGLGLSIASQIVRLMGGEIGAASEAGKGAEFEFWIPLKGSWEPSLAVESESERGTRERHSGRMVQGAVAEPLAEVVVVKSSPVSEATEMLSPVSEVPSSSSSGTLVPPEQSPSISPQVLDYFKPSSRRRKVLVTDDSPINRRILVRLLSVSLKKLYPNDQWTVEEAGDGTEAVEAVRRDLEGPNELELCFMDVVSCLLVFRILENRQEVSPASTYRSCPSWTATPQPRKSEPSSNRTRNANSQSWWRAPTKSAKTNGRLQERTVQSANLLARKRWKKC